MRATAIIPNWNGGARLRRMLESVAGMAPDRFERVLVIDNGSNDGSEALAATHGFELLRLERNFGFARAVNEGLRIAATPWVAILNNDIVLAADWLSQMAASEDHNDYLGGKLLQSSSPGKIDGGFDLISRAGTAWRAGQGTLDGPAWDKSRPAGLIPLTAALFRASIFESTGPLDERFLGVNT